MRAAIVSERVLTHPSDAEQPPEKRTRFVVQRIPPTVAAAIEDHCTRIETVPDPSDPSKTTTRRVVNQATLMVEQATAALRRIEHLLGADDEPIEVPRETNRWTGDERVARSAVDAMLDTDTVAWLWGRIYGDRDQEADAGEPSSQPTSSTTTS